MTHPPASRNYSEQQAGSLQAGEHLLLPDGKRIRRDPACRRRNRRFRHRCHGPGDPHRRRRAAHRGRLRRQGSGRRSRRRRPRCVRATPRESCRARPDGVSAVADARSQCRTPRRTPRTPQARAAPDRTAAVPSAVVVPPLPPAPPAATGPSEEDLALIPARQRHARVRGGGRRRGAPGGGGGAAAGRAAGQGHQHQVRQLPQGPQRSGARALHHPQGRRERPRRRRPPQRPALRRQPRPLGVGRGGAGAVQLHLPPARAAGPRGCLREIPPRARRPWKRTRSRPG